MPWLDYHERPQNIYLEILTAQFDPILNKIAMVGYVDDEISFWGGLSLTAMLTTCILKI